MFMKRYQIQDPMQTEVEAFIPKYLYLPGRPREYRYNAQTGQFSLYGETILVDSKGKSLQTITIQPIALRTFKDTLFARENEETWAEIFFIDHQDCVASILFSNTSVTELFRMIEPLFYEKLSVTDVKLIIRTEKVTSKKDPNKTWFVAKFAYEPLTDEEKETKKTTDEFITDFPVYRAETIQGTMQLLYASPHYKEFLQSETGYILLHRHDPEPDETAPLAIS